MAWLTILRKHVKNLWHDQQQLASLLPMWSRPSGQIFINNHFLVDAITVRTNIFSKGKILQKNIVKFFVNFYACEYFHYSRN